LRIQCAQLKESGHDCDQDTISWFPLSSSQRGILFHLLLQGENSPLYSIQGRSDLVGNIDSQLFLQAWQYLIKRHASLRTVVLYEDLIEPVQVTLPHVELDWSYTDLSIQPEDARNALQDSISEETVHNAISLIQAPLMRVALIKMTSERYHLIVDFHHIMFDGWSAVLLGDELIATYAALAKGLKPELAETGSFKDHVLTINSIEPQLTQRFWRDYLGDFIQTTPISTLQGQSQYFATGNQLHFMSKEATANLNQFANVCRVTPNIVIQAAWALLLAKLHNTNDVVYGVAVTGRSSGIQNFENTVGMFVNSLPMRVLIESNIKLGDWLVGLQSKQLSLLEFENSSLADIQHASPVGIRNALFDSLMVFQNVPAPLDSPDMPFEVINRRNHENSHLPLTVEVFPEEKLRLLFLYIDEYCSDELVSSVAIELVQIIENITNRKPESALIELSSDLGVTKWPDLKTINNTICNYDKKPSVVEQIFHQASLTPDKPAVGFKEEELSYAALIKRVDKLAER